jgi:hypothetical protein
VKRERKTWGGKVFESWQKKGSKRGEGGGAKEDEGGPMVEPALVEVDGGEGEDEVSEPVGQAEEVGLGGRVRGRNHKVNSCDD